MDCVVAAQALHWFDAAAARREFRRILRPEGWVVLLWNTRRIVGTPLLEAYEELLERHGTDYRQVRHDIAAPAKCAALFDAQPVIRRLPNWQRLDREGFRGRILSASYMPAPGQPGHEALGRDIDRIFDQHQREGWVSIEYDLEVVCGRLAP
jgi:SAM-dependent methyltransferase